MLPGSKRWALAAFSAGFSALGLSFSTQGVVPRWTGDRLQVTAPGLHFLTGRALERLHNGATVPYNFQLSLSTLPRGFPLERALERFNVSYDVWTEKFKVVQARAPRRSAANLAAVAAETWCLDQMSLGAAAVPPEKDLWVRLEIRAEDPAQTGLITDNGLSLASLIELFSRPQSSPGQEWTAEAGPFHMRDFKR